MTTIHSLTNLTQTGPLRALVTEFLDYELIQLHRVSGLQFEPASLVEKTFAHIDAYLPPRGRLLVAVSEDGDLVGCVFLKMIRPDAAEVKRLYVRPIARGQGLGRQLMDECLAQAQQLSARHVLLDTGVYDTAAHALYRSLGFREIGHYPEGENDADVIPHLVFMQLDL